MQRARAGIGTAISTGISMGLGNSLIGFLLSSGETFMELDRVLQQLDQRFGNAQGIRSFGAALGFTIEQSAQLAQNLGAATNAVDTSVAARYAGFARYRGMEAGQAMGQLGTIGRMQGGALTNAQLGGLLGGAGAVNMDRGRLPEYLQVVQQLMQMQQSTTGAAGVEQPQRLLQLAYRTAGGADWGAGQNAADFIGRLQGVISGGPMSVFMMRAMGYGKDPAMSYVDMRKRLEAGVSVPQNLASMFETFQRQGLGQGQMFRALESAAGGRLTAVEIDALVKELGTSAGLQRYREQPKGLSELVGDFAGLGASTVSRGEARAVQLEGMKMSVGDTVSQAMVDMTSSIQSLTSVITKIFGGGVGDLITGVSGGIKDLTGWLDKNTPNLDALGHISDTLDQMWAWVKGWWGSAPASPPPTRGQRGP